MELFSSFDTFLKIGPIEIKMYAVMILIGAGFAYLLGQYRFKQLGYDTEMLSDYLFSLLFIGILGARIWYVVFEFEHYILNPIEIFAVWHGGLAIQGGIFAGLIYSYCFFKKHEIPFFIAGDALIPGLLIAQAMGRWGNFFNHEAFGGEVSLEFLQSLHLPQFVIDNMYINGAFHHPTFLYESVANLIAFILIVFVIRRFQKHEGIQFFSYFLFYGIVRFPIEGLRTDSLMLGPIRMAQLISVVFVVAGIVGIVYMHKKGKEISYV